MRKNSWFLAMKWLRQCFVKLLRCMNQPRSSVFDRVIAMQWMQLGCAHRLYFLVTWLRWPGVRAYVYARCTTATEKTSVARSISRVTIHLSRVSRFPITFRVMSAITSRDRSERLHICIVHRSVTVNCHQPTTIPDLGEF